MKGSEGNERRIWFESRKRKIRVGGEREAGVKLNR